MTLKIVDGKFDYERTYYIAGPMTGYENYNYPAFDAALELCASAGIKAVSPHHAPWPANVADFSEEELWGAMIRTTMRMLLDCNGIIFLNGWTESRGALLEANVAAQLKFPAYFLDGRFLVSMGRRS